MNPVVSSVAESLARVRERVARACAAAGRDPRDVSILAVTKGFDSSAIEAALAAGLRDIGENYLQEAAAKFAQLSWPSGAKRHFIGRLQRNKARRIGELFDVVQTVDSLTAADVLDSAAGRSGKVLDVLIQVNVADDTRQGIEPEKLGDVVSSLTARRNLRLRGLMAVGPNDRAATRDAFARASACFSRVRAHQTQASILSMGMSDDLELAIACGSTMVRLGTALFGIRPNA